MENVFRTVNTCRVCSAHQNCYYIHYNCTLKFTKFCKKITLVNKNLLLFIPHSIKKTGKVLFNMNLTNIIALYMKVHIENFHCVNLSNL